MNTVICLAHQLPYPPNDGGKEGIWGICKQLVKSGKDVTLLCLTNKDYFFEKEGIKVKCVKISYVELTINIILSFLFLQHFKFKKYKSKRFSKYVQELVKTQPSPTIICFHPHITTNLNPRLPFYIRSHNIESDLVFSYLTSFKLGGLFRFLGYLARRHEVQLWKNAQKVFFLNDTDASQALKFGLSKDKIIVAYEGVFIRPVISTVTIEKKFKQKKIGYLFNDKAPQNRQNLKKFLSDYWLPSKLFDHGYTLKISGDCKNILKNLNIRKPSDYGILESGFVEYIDDFYSDISCLISPTFYGGGVRKKILESFSYSTPCLMTELDRESLSYLGEENLIAFNNVEDFTRLLIQIHHDIDFYSYACKSSNEQVRVRGNWKACVDVILTETKKDLN